MKRVKKATLFETWFKNFPFSLTVSIKKTVNIIRRISIQGEPSKTRYSLWSTKPLKPRFVPWKSGQRAVFRVTEWRRPGGMSYYSSVEAREKLTQRLGLQTIHKIVPSSVSSLAGGGSGRWIPCSCSVCFTVFTCLSCKDTLVFGGLGQGFPSREYTNWRMRVLKAATPLMKCGGGR